jgi:hypothetical protein
LTSDELVCAIARNAEAGALWLELVSGQKDSHRLHDDALLSLIANTIATSGELRELELADLGWLAAETIRRWSGGQFSHDRAQGRIWLVRPAGTRLDPMGLIALAYGRQRSLVTAAKRFGQEARSSADRPHCAGLQSLDVLRGRLLDSIGNPQQAVVNRRHRLRLPPAR